MKKRKIVSWVLVALLGLFVVTAAAFFIMFGQQIITIKGIKPESPANMYSLDYHADYYFDEFLNEGAENDKALERFIVSHVSHGLMTEVSAPTGMCTSFICRNENGEVLFGRNFDFTFSPVVMLTTKPESGYSCITSSNLAFAGYNKNYRPDPNTVSLNNVRLLGAPYFGTDGMNEYGLAMSILYCGTAELPKVEGKPILSTTTTVRMVLENAKTVDEAVELMRQYNYYFTADPAHFMLADASGRATVVEFCNGEIVTVDSPVVTNFDLYDPRHLGVGQSRYQITQNRLNENNGVLSENEALKLLSEVVMPGMGQYSVLYNLTTGDVYAFTGGDYTKTGHFNLNMSNKED